MSAEMIWTKYSYYDNNDFERWCDIISGKYKKEYKMNMIMIERVAKEIFNKFKEIHPDGFQVKQWDELTTSGKQIAIELAKAAIKAMRKPTDKMLMTNTPDMPAGGSVLEIWQDMIDEALKE